jgi:phosphoglycerate dehydrogenase-like enzyme
MTMKLSIYYPDLVDPAWEQSLRSMLHPDLQVSVGPEVPEPVDYQILVSGRPTVEQLDASSELHTLIIPWAGIPPVTMEKLVERPELAVHNLHYNAAETAEMALALLLAASKFIVPMDRTLREGDWRPRYGPNPSLLLEGRTALILGLGEIGRRVAKMCLGLSMKVVAIRREGGQADVDGEIKILPAHALNDLLPQAQVLMICLPLTDQTNGLIGKKELAQLPQEALVVNVGRGPIVDEGALFAALQSGVVAGAGLDVWYEYPKDEASREKTYPSAHAFHTLDNVVMSPHRAGGSRQRMLRRLQALATLLNAAARGEPMSNKVDINLGY